LQALKHWHQKVPLRGSTPTVRQLPRRKFFGSLVFSVQTVMHKAAANSHAGEGAQNMHVLGAGHARSVPDKRAARDANEHRELSKKSERHRFLSVLQS
jgi:hypothetical protein